MKKLIILYVSLIGVFLVETLLFMLYHHDVYGAYPATDWLRVLWYSLPHDLTMAGYVVALPLVAGLVYIWLPGRWYSLFCRWFLTLMSAALILIWLVDTELFSYWGFRLDATPLIYLLDSPGETLSQASFLQYLLAVVVLALLVFLAYRGLIRLFTDTQQSAPSVMVRMGQTLAGLLLAALCFVAIRGGVTESTMNIGRAYFSHEMMLNQAAVNPVFSFFYAVSRREDYGEMYRFMSDEECQSSYQELLTPSSPSCPPSLPLSEVVRENRPNILLLILEGFSGGALTALYPDEADPRVMPCLTRLYSEGVSFTRFYANSWRTDRGVASILAAYPAQPKHTVMKEQNKCNHLQYLSQSLRQEGYDLEFVYGGDVNFTNMKGFLRAGGFDRIYGNTDFPKDQQISKWGVPDGYLYDFLLSEVEQEKSDRWLKVALTLSSHEPFDVPDFHRIPEHPFANSLAYADSCLGDFIDRLKTTPVWDNLLVIALPDHCCTYPDLERPDPMRYHIPMVWFGGAIAQPQVIDVLGQQTDLAATLLAQLGIDHSAFNFSHDLLHPDHRPFAFYDFPDGFGLITDSCLYVQDNEQDGVPLKWSHDPDHQAERWGKAYLQHLFDDLDKR